MGKLYLQEFVTVDGYAAAPDGALNFMPAGGKLPADPQIERDQLRFIREDVETMLLGRTTYEMFAQYWPTAKSEQDVIADNLNALSKVVASRKLIDAPWGSRGEHVQIAWDGVKTAAELRKRVGKGVVVWGSLTLAKSLTQAALVDEFHLIVCPNALGAGKPVFASDAGTLDLRLLDAKRYETGVVLLRYAPA